MSDIPQNYREIKKVLQNSGVGKLRERGFDPNGLLPPGVWGRTYLLIACAEGNVRVVRGLLDLGASTAATDERGFTALMLACYGAEEERAELVECLLERVDACACIDSAATSGFWSGRTALHLAARCGNAAVVRVLLRFSADATKRDEEGCTAVMLARAYRKVEVAQLIENWNPLEEWRPWTHAELPKPYRDAMRTLLLLAKT